MKTPAQTPKYAQIMLIKLLKNNSSLSISRLFRRLRSYKRLSCFGDFQILHLIISTMAKLGIKINKSRLLYAYNKIDELKQNTKEEKHDDIQQLLSSIKFVENHLLTCRNMEDKRKVNKIIIKSSSETIYA